MSVARRLLWRWGPVAACAAVIFVLSSLSLWRIPLHLNRFLGADKLVHMAEYFALGLVVSRAVHPAGRRFWWRYALIAAAATALYGVSDEIHQYYTPGRIPDLWDAAADVIGAFLAATLWPSVSRWLPWTRA